MKCPWCGYEMEEGRLRSQRTILYAPGSKDSFFQIFDEKIVQISRNNFFAPVVDAYSCRGCGKIVVDGVAFDNEKETAQAD